MLEQTKQWWLTRNTLIFWSVFAILGILNFSFFLSGYRLTADDVFYHFFFMSGVETVLEAAHITAVEQGRISMYIGLPLNVLGAALVENPFLRALVYGLHFFSLYLFALYVARLSALASPVFIFIVMISTQALEFEHLPPNSYPLLYSPSVIAIIVTRLLVIKLRHPEQKGDNLRGLLLVSLGLIATLLFEILLLFYAVLVVLESLIHTNSHHKFSLRRTVSRYRFEILGLSLAAIAMVAFRLINPSQYPGNQVNSAFDFFSIANSIFGSALGGYGFTTFLRNTMDGQTVLDTVTLVIPMALGILTSIAVVLYLKNNSKNRVRVKVDNTFRIKTLMVILVAACLMVLPTSLTPKYQEACNSLIDCTYHDSRLSFYFSSSALSIALIWLFGKLKSDSTPKKARYYTTNSVIIAISSATAFANISVADEMLSHSSAWHNAKVFKCNELGRTGLDPVSFIEQNYTISMHSTFDRRVYWETVLDQLSKENNCDGFLFQTGESLSEQVNFDFSQKTTSNELLYVAGLSRVEEWGRWADSNLSESVMIVLREPLPSEVAISLSLKVFSESQNKQFFVRVGSEEYSGLLNQGSKFDFELITKSSEGANVIEILPPPGVSPYELGQSQDKRQLSVGLISMKISPLNENTRRTIGNTSGSG